ncbi:uncharacterized protein LOC125520783 isoform X2 [Triticum urartu]|uniref:uncharacterized protein LOC125520608 isoform X2 n=1 Tax=Triticum urartu TaxID=4572 RepID=UPI0020436E1C|nr:uncharacterized protein LOC125520608 isoform X2 [Triticum urartu]XP_048541761.1 uncharacterized protein LOC125520783 isoform X2 [Triticum urartu]
MSNRLSQMKAVEDHKGSLLLYRISTHKGSLLHFTETHDVGNALCFINQHADAWYYNHVTYQIEARIHKRQYQAATTLRRQQQQDEDVNPADARRCRRDICEGKHPFREISEKNWCSAAGLCPRVVLLFHMAIAGLPNSAVSPTAPAAPLFAGALAAVLDISSLCSSCLVDIHMYRCWLPIYFAKDNFF